MTSGRAGRGAEGWAGRRPAEHAEPVCDATVIHHLAVAKAHDVDDVYFDDRPLGDRPATPRASRARRPNWELRARPGHAGRRVQGTVGRRVIGRQDGVAA